MWYGSLSSGTPDPGTEWRGWSHAEQERGAEWPANGSEGTQCAVTVRMLVAFGGGRGFCAMGPVAVVSMARGMESVWDGVRPFRNTAGAGLFESDSDA